ncbi:superinfection exclusion B family protein [Sulfurimonas sp. SAG-AH-194-I05]|nr:super-infection exclusion protein B [Sulfurimonas sp. SAG-AH-194-I05]MDF1875796.1 superinfection exclusion B family protein [Sulfurimonas sp. SAG-AH-194-I05]
MSETFDKFLKLLHLEPRTLFGIVLLGSILLFGTEEFLTTFGLELFRNDYKGWIGIITLISAIFFLIQLLPWIQNIYHQYKYEQKVIEYLSSLSREESLLLLYCKRKKQQSLSLPVTHGTAKSLVSKGIMEQAGGNGSMMEWPYTVSNIVWKKILTDETVLPHIVPDDELKRYEQVIYNIY